jgi:hypothetical protein
MDAISYLARPLNSIPPAELSTASNEIQALCSPSGADKHSLSVGRLLSPDSGIANLTLGILRNGNTLVGGILYKDQRSTGLYEIERLFVCASKGFGSIINKEFEKEALRTDSGRIRVSLNSVVDPGRNVARFHMMNGYKPLKNSGQTNVAILSSNLKEIPMVKYIPSEPLTSLEKEQIESDFANAAKIREQSRLTLAKLRPLPGRLGLGGRKTRRKLRRTRHNRLTKHGRV